MNTLTLLGIYAGVTFLGVAILVGALVVALLKVSSKMDIDSEELNMKGEDFL